MSKKRKIHGSNEANLEELLNRVKDNIITGDMELVRYVDLPHIKIQRYKRGNTYVAIEVTKEYIKISESHNGALFGIAKHYFNGQGDSYTKGMEEYYKKINILR